MSEALFCLYTASLLIEIMHTGHSRLFPHWWKGCYDPVCPLPTAMRRSGGVAFLIAHPAAQAGGGTGRFIGLYS
jgi:hypothetical protein